MATVLILCPTFDHADSLFASIASVRIQSFMDWELVVIGDGAPQRTREIVDTIRARDGRIHFVSHEKAARHGEEYRDPVIRASNAEFVCHLNDDDLWAPNHLASMVGLLEQAEWVNQSPLRLLGDGRREWWLVNNGTPPARAAAEELREVTAGINYVGYRRQAYLRLPEGWTTTPAEAGPSDQFMWRKFFRDRSLSIASTARSTALKFATSTPGREKMKPEQRLAELAPWLARISEPGLVADQCRSADVGNRLARVFAIHGAEDCATLEEAFARSGMQPAGPAATPLPGLNGAPMVVPLTETQRAQAWRSWAMLRAYAGPGEGVFGQALLASLDPDIEGWRDAVAALGWDRLDAALEAAADFRRLTGDSAHALVLSAGLAIKARRLDEAADMMARAKRKFPEMEANADLAAAFAAASAFDGGAGPPAVTP